MAFNWPVMAPPHGVESSYSLTVGNPLFVWLHWAARYPQSDVSFSVLKKNSLRGERKTMKEFKYVIKDEQGIHAKVSGVILVRKRPHFHRQK